MIDRVANQVNYGWKHPLGDGLVEFGRTRFNLELDGLARTAAHASHDQRHAFQQFTHGHHARARDAAAQIAQASRVLVDDGASSRTSTP